MRNIFEDIHGRRIEKPEEIDFQIETLNLSIIKEFRLIDNPFDINQNIKGAMICFRCFKLYNPAAIMNRFMIAEREREKDGCNIW